MNVSQPVMEVLSAAVVAGPELRLTGQLDRKLYTDTNKVLEAAGFKWNRKAGAHLIDGDAADAIEPILLTGTYTRTKQDFGQFDSPSEVVEQIMWCARIEPGMTVLEPSAGVGRIAKEAADAGATVYAVEIDKTRVAKLEAVAEAEAYPNILVSERDFLSIDPSELAKFDRVVMNPPFARQADIDHVRHAYKFLKPTGRLVSVMSAGVRFRQDRKATEFRQWVEELGGIFEDLPENAFVDSGTRVSTCIVTIG